MILRLVQEHKQDFEDSLHPNLSPWLASTPFATSSRNATQLHNTNPIALQIIDFTVFVTCDSKFGKC